MTALRPSYPAWLAYGLTLQGIREIKGPKHNATIVGWLKKLKAWWTDDETPWCGTFVAACMQAAGQPLPANWMRAKAWLDWGVPIAQPVVGAVVIFDREGGGHVGIVVGRDQKGNLMVLGGNQGDMVKISPFSLARNPRYRIPRGYSVPLEHYTLPLVTSDGKLSTNEA